MTKQGLDSSGHSSAAEGVTAGEAASQQVVADVDQQAGKPIQVEGPEQSDPPPRLSRWRKVENACRPLADFFETSPVVRLAAVFAAIVGFLLVIGTAVQILIDLQDRADEREARRQDAIERAWTRLLLPAVGNTGKGGALTVLAQNGVSVDRVDLSCRALGRWDEQAHKCLVSVIFEGVVLRSQANGADLSNPFVPVTATNNIEGISLQDAVLRNIEIHDFVVSGEFQRSRWNFITVKNSRISGDFSEAEFFVADFTGSTVEFTGTMPLMQGINVSGALVPWLENFLGDGYHTFIAGRTVAAWADHPPLKDGDIFANELLPVSERILDAINLCAPPEDAAGKLVPLEDRDADLTSSSVSFAIGDCEPMTAEEAKAAFPAAYAPRKKYDFKFKVKVLPARDQRKAE